jgi:hypothetical protein
MLEARPLLDSGMQPILIGTMFFYLWHKDKNAEN